MGGERGFQLQSPPDKRWSVEPSSRAESSSEKGWGGAVVGREKARGGGWGMGGVGGVFRGWVGVGDLERRETCSLGLHSRSFSHEASVEPSSKTESSIESVSLARAVWQSRALKQPSIQRSPL